MKRKRLLAAALPIAVLGCFTGCERDRTATDAPTGAAAQASCTVAPYDEFISLDGVSSSWVNLASYGGLPGQDITTALRNALSPLTGLPATALHGGASTLYIPPGSYTISGTVQLLDAMGVTIVGDDPSTTSIHWTGPANGVMFQIVDTGYSKLSRLTLDGGGTAEATVELVQSPCYPSSSTNASCGLPASNAPGNSMYFLEFNDDVFENAEMGIVADYGLLTNEVTPSVDPYVPGTIVSYNSNQGNMVVRRCQFNNFPAWGIVLADQEALDWLIADSQFYNNGFSGSTTTPSAAIGSVYFGSIVAVNNYFAHDNRDIYLPGARSNIIRGNTSIGSNAFLWMGGAWQSMVDVSGNYVATSGSPVTAPNGDECSTAYGLCVGEARLTLLDNYLSVGSGVGVYTLATPSIAEGGNSFVGSSSSFIQPWGSNPAPTVLNVALDSTGASPPVPAAASFAYNMTFNPGANPWGARPTKSTRAVTNVHATFTDCLTQTNTTCAANLTNWLKTAPQGSALYFPYYWDTVHNLPGMYYINAPIDVPAGLDVTLFGDGFNSHIVWEGQPGQASDPYMIHFHGDTASPVGSVRDLYLLANSAGTSRPGAIQIDVADASTGGSNPAPVGDMVFLDQLGASFAKSLVDVAGLDYTLVRLDQAASGGERVLGVIGAGAGAQGSSHTEGVVMFGGGATPSSTFADLKNWGKAVLIGTDNEGFPQGFTLNGSGYLSMDGARLITGTNPSPYWPTQPDVLLQSTFHGNVTVMNLDDMANIISSSNSEASVLSLANQRNNTGACGGTTCSFTQENTLSRQMALQDENLCGFSLYSCTDQAGLAPGAFAGAMLSDLRNTMAAPGFRPCNVANVRVHRVNFEGITTGVPADLARAAVRVQHR
jgi:hypothetical protein